MPEENRRENRKELIRQIEEKRNSKVIVYITSDRRNLSSLIAGDIIPIIHEHILELESNDQLKLDLFLYSRGGDSDVPWTLVSMFREYSKKGSFSVIVPYRAHSAATVVALGADEILMTRKAELGPIDITLQSGPYNPIEKDSSQKLPISVEDVLGYFGLLEKVGCERPDEKMKGFDSLTNNVHPLALGNINRLLEETKLVATRLLNTRAKPFTEEENQEIVKKISSEIYSHSHTISRSEAVKYIGLKQVKECEDYNIEDEVWSLYNEYNKLFCFNQPFMPEEFLMATGSEEHIWEKLKIACVESYNRLDICKIDTRVKIIRNIPPNINLNLNPTINMPQLPNNLNQNQISAILQQHMDSIIPNLLNDSVRLAVNELVRSLPLQKFERVTFNTGWSKDTEQ